MNTFKKIGLGLTLVSALVVTTALLGGHKANAAAPNFNLKFGNSTGSTIVGSYNGASLTFDVQSKGPNWAYQIQGSNGPVCEGSVLFVNANTAQNGEASQATANAGEFAYKPTSTSSCTSYGGTIPVAAAGGGAPQSAEISWSEATGVLSSDGSSILVTFQNGSALTFFDSNPGDTTLNFKPQAATTGSFGGASVAGWCANTAEGTGDPEHGINLSSYTATSTSGGVICYNNGGVNPVVQNIPSFPVDTSAYSAGGGTAPNSCESGYTGAAHEFNWISCKILAGLDGLTNTFLGIVQNQLDVCTGKSSTTGNTCSNNILTDQVKQAWRIFRVIATSILVIILLVMVISQAIGSGPFDAYTLRKVLPRLVAIAIFMQISWYVFKFVIDVSNDVGVGIAQLMYFPFGGAGKMSLDNLIGGVGVLAPGFTITALFTGIVVGYIAGGLTIFGVIFLGASAVISLIIGLLVLLFRQILIILLMIFVPIALVAWILPGTQRYWKLWQDNFMKILFMFPLITAMIAGGRIFAFVGATKGVLGLFVVLLGFFGPLWFLPKTFKWGGQAFGALSSAAWQGTQKYRNAPSKYALQKAGVNREQMRASRAERLAEGEGRRWDSLLSGRFNYALGRTSRTRRYRETVEKGRESGDKEALRQIIGSEYERQDHPAKLSTLRNVAQGHLDASTGIDGRNQAAQRWALDQLATFGDWDIISNMRENGQLDERTWQMFVAKNIGKIHQEAPHLSPQRTDLSMIGSQDFASMKPFGFEEWERQFNTGTDRNATTTRVQPSANPEAKRVRMVQQARRALGDDRIMAYVSEPDRARLERVAGADIRGQSVQVTRDARGVIDHVFLPDAGSMADPATAPAAFASIDQFMQNAEPRASAFARQAVGRELGGGSLSIPEQDALEAHLMDIKGQAATSLQARETYNQVVAAAHDELSARVQRAEQEAVTQGMTPAQISNARTVVEAQVDALRQRFINNGLTPY